jgi:moderate conductance mechanosensitive channel
MGLSKAFVARSRTAHPGKVLAMIAHALAAELAASRSPDSLQAACGSEPGTICRMIWDLSHNGSAASSVAAYVAGPVSVALKILFVILLAFIVRFLVHRAINRITSGAAALGTGTNGNGRGRSLLPERTSERRRQRSRALGSLLRNASTILIFSIAGITILGDLGINLAPILASAGVLGVALGFGAQNLVGDFLAGVAILLEDQYGVGDVITIGTTSPISGTVEAVGLRVTQMRDVNGMVWHVRNGSLQQVGNQSQGWARAVIDIPVPYSQDASEVREVMTEVAAAAWAQSQWKGVILEEPTVWGVQSLSSSEATWRLVAMSTPPRRAEVERALREQVKQALDARGITAAAPTNLVLSPADSPAAAGPAPPADDTAAPPPKASG